MTGYPDRSSPPTVPLITFTWQNSSTEAIFPPGDFVEYFMLTETATSLALSFYGGTQGAPGPLAVSVYTAGGLLVGTGSISTPLGSAGVWTPQIPIALGGKQLAPGSYYAVVTCPSGNASNYYWLALCNYPSWWDPNALSIYNPPPGRFGNSGGSIIRVYDQNGETVTLPYCTTPVGGGSQSFVASTAFSFKTVSPWVSDIDWTDRSGTLSVVDVTTSQVVGTSTFDQPHTSHGIQGMISFELDKRVTTIPGHTYRVDMTTWGTYLRTNTVNPSSVGFQGQARTNLMMLLDTSFVVGHLDYLEGSFPCAGDGAIAGRRFGVRFQPTANGILNEVQVKMYTFAGPGFYTAGTPVTVSVWSDKPLAISNNDHGSQPNAQLAFITIDSGTIPKQGWLDAKGFSLPVTGGANYWVVVSTNGSTEYVQQRCVSPWRSLSLVDPGTGWTFPGQGPTDYSWKVFTTAEVLGNAFDSGEYLPLSSKRLAAQPFSVPSQGNVNCVFLDFQPSSNADVIQAAIYPDNGSGTRPNMSQQIAVGSFTGVYLWNTSGHYIPVVGSNPTLQPGTKYWLVVSSPNATPTVSDTVYWKRYGASGTDQGVQTGFDALISSDGGATWSPANAAPNQLIFRVGYATGASSTRAMAKATISVKQL